MEDTLTTVERKRVTDTLPVYFAGKTGTLAIVSDDHKTVDSRGTREKIVGLHLNFGDRGVTRALDPVRDADYIKSVREWIEDGNDWRIKAFNIREIRNTEEAPAAPFPLWDSTNAEGIKQAVKISGYDLRTCVLYEEQNMNRDDVLRALDELAAEALVEEKPKPQRSAFGVHGKPSL